MSIIVKDMKMPESCYYCGLTDTSFINCHAFEKPILLEDDCEERRPDWCPLVALPDKHGDLIDRGALKKMSYEVKDNIGYVQVVDVWDIDREPTIVESEDSE